MKPFLINVHGLTKENAMKKVKSEMLQCQKKGIKEIHIIHGYNGGNALKMMFIEKSNYGLNLIDSVLPHPANSGITIVFLK